jgi:hypothetical protein
MKNIYGIIYAGKPVICSCDLRVIYEYIVVHANEYNLLVFPVFMVLETLFVKSFKVEFNTADNQPFTVHKFEYIRYKTDIPE